jgi:hypothetical protein
MRKIGHKIGHSPLPQFSPAGFRREASPMTRHKPPEPPVDRLDIDHGVNNAPPPRKQRSAQQGPSYLWNGTHQQLIEILPEDHPNYQENRELVSKMIRLWDQAKSK